MGDEKLELSQHALAALKEFYEERDDQEKRFEELQHNAGRGKLSMDMFSEDWNSSQFWYADETATLLARELLEAATKDTSIAIISAPSVYVQVHNLLLESPESTPCVKLFEFDDRFSVCEGFVHYDFNRPVDLPVELKGNFDRILCDPPFLSKECQEKVASTVLWLSTSQRLNELKTEDADFLDCKARLLVCTGERMEGLIIEAYPDIKTTSLRPRHAQDRLSNAFRCYANYHSRLGTWQWHS